MEKFGIFELLDALSALTLPDSASVPQPQQTQKEDLQPPRAEDAAFSPPVYGGYAPERTTRPAPAEQQAEPPSVKEQDALSALLSRQEEISKRIDKRR